MVFISSVDFIDKLNYQLLQSEIRRTSEMLAIEDRDRKTDIERVLRVISQSDHEFQVC